jgi:integrase
VLGERWHGWHAFRRGLTTNLFDLGVPAEVSQLILRHADVETTRRHYLRLQEQKQGAAAMRQFEAAIKKAKIGKQTANSNLKKSTS